MNNKFANPLQKVLKKYVNDPDIAPILKDIANAQQGCFTFSKDVKKYMLKFIYQKYNENHEVWQLIDILKKSSAYESFSELEIFKLGDECYFWYDFLNSYALWKIIEKTYGWESEEEKLTTLVRIFREDLSIFTEYDRI